MPTSFGRYRCMCPRLRTGRNCQLIARPCGGVLNSLNGTLKYPLSDHYPHNTVCAWLIKTNEDKVLNVTFTRFNVELSLECRYDWLQIHDGRSSAAYMIGRYKQNVNQNSIFYIHSSKMIEFSDFAVMNYRERVILFRLRICYTCGSDQIIALHTMALN